MLVLFFSNLSALGLVNLNDTIKTNDLSYLKDNPSKNIKKVEIRVAVFSKTIYMVSCENAFYESLNDYSWIVGNTQYNFVVDKIYDKDVYSGKLSTKNFDVLVMPGGGAGGGCRKTKWQVNRPSVYLWRKNMINFIESGGGFYGVCGGTWFLCGFDKPPRSFAELKTHRSSLGVSCVKFERNEKPSRNMIFSQLIGNWDQIGAGAAYMLYSGWDFGPTQIYPSCLYINVTVNRDHAFFDDYLDDTVRISWSAGPRYVVPEEPDREVWVLARLPEEEFSDNESTRIHYWRYTGGIQGIIKGIFKHVKKDKSLFGIHLANSWYMASDWKKTDKIIETNCSNKPFMTAEIYPNENKSRIFLCSGHPEAGIFFGGEVIELPDTRSNNLYNGLIGWDNYSDPDETVEDELTYLWWMIRRGVAWAAKLNENDLPPIYGPSQVSDIYPYEQNLSFNLIGNSVVSDGIETLDLLYKYSKNNDSWSDWTYYTTDSDDCDGWSWAFDSPNGTGYYQFCSRRRVRAGDEEIVENTPKKGPDAIAYVKKN